MSFDFFQDTFFVFICTSYYNYYVKSVLKTNAHSSLRICLFLSTFLTDNRENKRWSFVETLTWLVMPANYPLFESGLVAGFQISAGEGRKQGRKKEREREGALSLFFIGHPWSQSQSAWAGKSHRRWRHSRPYQALSLKVNESQGQQENSISGALSS